MLLNPKVGSRARIWYGKASRYFMPYHGMVCTVLKSGRGSPRNHLVELRDGRRVIVPCGNLNRLFKDSVERYEYLDQKMEVLAKIRKLESAKLKDMEGI